MLSKKQIKNPFARKSSLFDSTATQVVIFRNQICL